MLAKYRSVVGLNQPHAVSKLIITGAVVPQCISQSLLWMCVLGLAVR